MCTTITMFKNSLTMFKNLLKNMLFMYFVLPIGAACLHVFGWRETCFIAYYYACMCVLIFLVAKCGLSPAEAATWKALTWKALFGRNYEWQ